MEWKVRQTGYYVRMSYLLLFLVFVLCGIFTILAGGKVYVNMNSRRAEQYSSSVALHYIANQVRQGDGEDIIKVIEADGTSILEFERNLAGASYIKWIYYYNGSIRELFTRQDSGMGLTDGIPIVECEGLSFMQNGRLLIVDMAGKEGGRLYLYLRSGDRN